MSDTTLLLPCPFCGDSQHSRIAMTSFDEEPPRKWTRVKCGTCAAMVADAIWNKRADTMNETLRAVALNALKAITILETKIATLSVLVSVYMEARKAHDKLDGETDPARLLRSAEQLHYAESMLARAQELIKKEATI